MRICSHCAKEFDDLVTVCPDDGTPLGPPSASADRLIGYVLDGKYRLEEMIGQGGMGTVYRALHVLMHTSFAVKMLHRDSVADEGTVERFRREALAAARIRHPNAVTVTDFGVTDVGAYLVMEYLEGSDLRRKLRDHGRLPADTTVAIIVQVCGAIERAHRSGLIHRDIKPDNIWLVTDEETGAEIVKVLDFGIAKLRKPTTKLDALTKQGTMIGTPYYMSPEQCLGGELDPRSDVYSIGCVLYEMLTGEVPFAGDNPVAIGMKHNTEEPRPLREHVMSIPEAIEAVVLKSLAKKAWNRQSSARDLAIELASALAGSTGTESANEADVSTILGSRITVGASSPTASQHVLETIVDGVSTIVDGPTSRGAPFDEVRTVTDAHSISSRSRWPVVGAIAVAAGLLIAAVFWLPNVWRGSVTPAGDPPLTASAEPEAAPTPPPIDGMVFIPGGTYRIGTDRPDAMPESQPVTEVVVRNFYIDTHEVTNASYAEYVRDRGVPAPPHWKGGRFAEGTELLPVTNVTWFEAKAFAKWAKKRLPTEEEWEAAARGFEGRPFPWGEEWSSQFANSEVDRTAGPAAVGSYPLGASRSGIYDLASNVAEWVDDEYEPYPGSPAKRSPGNCIYRGGTFRSPQKDHLSWGRFYAKPESRSDVRGFRCAKDL